MGHAVSKLERLQRAKHIYLAHPDGVSDGELARLLGVTTTTAFRYRKELRAVSVGTSRYTLNPTWEDIALAEAVLRRAPRMAGDARPLGDPA